MIDLEGCTDKCFADMVGQCAVLSESISTECNSVCPFYKPTGCKDWVRVEDYEGIWLYSPEEYEKEFKNETDHKQGELYWRIKSVFKRKKRF